MKIIHVCKVWYPRTTGVTVHVDCLAGRMSDAGNKVWVLTYSLSDSSANKTDQTEYENNGYRVIQVRPGRPDRIFRAIKKIKPDVVHAHGIWEHVPSAWRGAKAVNARFYLTAHGTWQFLYSTPGMEPPSRRLYYRCYYHTMWRWMVRHANAMIALNAIEENAHRSLGAKKIHRIPNGVDCQEFHPDAPRNHLLKKELPDHYILYAGAVQTQKGIFILIEAFDELKQKGIVLNLVVAGEGPDFEKARKLAAKRKVNATFSGRVDRQHMPGLMAGADIFILPSENEPFATVYLEAMAGGTPCIGTGSGGTPEIIDPGKNGFLVPVNGVTRLASLLEEISGDYPRLQDMGNNARQKALNSFDWSILVPKLLRAYRN